MYFLSDTSSFLKHQVEVLGYDTCHRIEEYDVKTCYDDCERLKKEEFATKCKKEGGLFKCCIRYKKKQLLTVVNYGELLRPIES